MADESEKTRRAALGERLKAMFKSAEKLPLPDKLRDASAEADTPPESKQRGRKR